jgi:hypothetical protein
MFKTGENILWEDPVLHLASCFALYQTLCVFSQGLLQNVHLVFENSVEDVLSKKGGCATNIPLPFSDLAGFPLNHVLCVCTHTCLLCTCIALGDLSKH